MGKRFKKHCKGICWKKSSSDSEVEDDAKGKIIPAKEDSNIAVQTKPQKLSKTETHAVQYSDVVKTLSDINAKLDTQGKLNTEAISNYYVLYKELVKEVKSVRQDCSRQEAVILSLQKKLNDVTTELAEVKAAHDKPRDVSSHVDICAPVSLVSRATGPDIPYTNVGVSRDGIDQSCSSNVASQPPLIDTGVQVFDLPHSKKEMRTSACGPDGLLEKSNVAFKPSMVDIGIHASYLYLQPSLKNWNVTPLDLYCKGPSVRDHGRLQKGASRHGFLLGNPKGKLSIYDPSPPPLYSTKNNRPSKQDEIQGQPDPGLCSNEKTSPIIDTPTPESTEKLDVDPQKANVKVDSLGKPVSVNKNVNNCDEITTGVEFTEKVGIAIAKESYTETTYNANNHHVSEKVALRGMFGTAVDGIGTLNPLEIHAKLEEWTIFHTADDLKWATDQKLSFPVNKYLDIVKTPQRLCYFDLIPSIDLLSPRPTRTLTLRHIMEQSGNCGIFKEAHARYLCINILACVQFLHSQGMFHSNIFANSVVFNSYGFPSLMLDVKEHGPKIPPRIESCSPEEITSGPITMATDIFQTGLLVYSLLYGRSPFRGSSYQETKENLLNDGFVPQFEAGTMSNDGRDFIRACLRRDPELRFKFMESSKSLGSAINWFSMYKVDGLTNQTFDSPFKDLLLEYT